MQRKPPLVSIGLPVYNGQNYLKEAIESVLAQTYDHFELIISDNGSTDHTGDICEQYQKLDSRVQYHRFSKNYGASRNYNRTFELSRGKYFKWLAHDDKLHPDNLIQSVDFLEQNEDVVLCGTEKITVNAYGEKIDTCDYEGLALNSDDPVRRYKAFLHFFESSFAMADFVFGLIRSRILAQTHLIGNYTSADFTLLAELIHKGKFHIIQTPLFIRRFHHGMSMSVYNDKPQEAVQLHPSAKMVYKSHAEVAKWYDPNGKVRYIPHFKWLNELNRSIKETPFSGKERLRMFYYSYRWFYNRFLKSLKRRLLVSQPVKKAEKIIIHTNS